MKKFLKLIFHSALGRRLRDIIGYRPQLNYYNDFDRNTSSDLYFWTTKDGLSTVFKVSNILGKYYDISSSLLLVINTSCGQRLAVHRKKFDTDSITIVFDDSIVPQDSCGTFYALLIPDEAVSSSVNVVNRCYVGYGASSEYSMMHGNQVAIMCPLENDRFSSDSTFEPLPALNPIKAKFEYFLQESLSSEYRNTLLFTNPLKRKITVELMSKVIEIPSMGCEAVDVTINSGKERVKITSDFAWPRPSIIIRKDGFIDAHHC